MKISPPMAVVVIMSALVAATVWFKPPQGETALVEVMLPNATYQTLALWGKGRAGDDGRPLTVAQTIEELAKALER